MSVKNNKKQELITFKVDQSLAEMIKRLPNRSDFIRNAILKAFDNLCPLCGGMGLLTPDQQKHWDSFAAVHNLTECNDCHVVHLTCSAGESDHIH